jgi:hypothetical protein
VWLQELVSFQNSQTAEMNFHMGLIATYFLHKAAALTELTNVSQTPPPPSPMLEQQCCAELFLTLQACISL